MKYMKLIGVTFGALILLISGVYGAFLLTEYFTGNSYVDYLTENKESKLLNKPMTFELMQDDLEQKQLVLVGEIHGFKVPNQFDVELFTYLNQKHQFSTYLVEMDYSQAYFLNKYNQTGDERLLTDVLKNWVVSIGRDNLDYKKRWQQLRELHQSGHPFLYIGTDKLKDVTLLVRHLNELTTSFGGNWGLERTESEQLEFALVEITKLIEKQSTSSSLTWQLQHLKKNIRFKLDSIGRETVMTSNLLDLYENYGLYEAKVYGFYGLGHTLLKPIASGHNPMAARLVHNSEWFKDNILVINMLFADSYMTVKSEMLPSFLRTDTLYSKLSVSYDSILTYYAYGIMDLLRVTSPQTKTLFKINNLDSPYDSSQRLFNSYKLLPFGQKISALDKTVTSDYGQYLLFIRNSDWAQP